MWWVVYLWSDLLGTCKQTLLLSFTRLGTHAGATWNEDTPKLALIAAAPRPSSCSCSLSYVNEIKTQGGRQGDKTEEWATAAVVMVRTFNFDWLEAWPEAFGRPLLTRGSESDRKRPATHTDTLNWKQRMTTEIKKRYCVYVTWNCCVWMHICAFSHITFMHVGLVSEMWFRTWTCVC